MSNSLWPQGLQQARLPCPSPSLRVCSNSCPLSWWCHPTISFSVAPFSSCPQSFPASGSFSMSRIFASAGQSMPQLQHQSFQWIFRVDFPEDWLVWSPCCPRDFQKSSLAPQFESINSVAFCLLYGPALTTVHDHWDKLSFQKNRCNIQLMNIMHV